VYSLIKKTVIRYWKLSILAAIIVQTILFSLAFISESSEAQNITNPFDSGGIDSKFYKYEGRVYLVGNLPGNDLFLHGATNCQMYRKFEVHMLANQHSFYKIIMDNQTYKTGEFDFWTKVEVESPYNYVDVEVILQNRTGVELPKFTFYNMYLIGAPPPSEGGDEEDTSTILDPYIQMTRGELNAFVALRLFSDISLTILGFLAGSSSAVIRSDYQGVYRVA